MQDEKYAELESRAAGASQEDAVRHLETKAMIHRTIEQMKLEGTAMALSADEDEMLREYRRFKLRMRKEGEVFRWQTRKPEGIQLAAETAEIVHPREGLPVTP